MTALTFDPQLPASLFAAIAVASAALLGWYALRRPSSVPPRRWWSIIALMTIGIALVLALLLNPTLVRELPPPAGTPRLTILVDATGSMATPDAPSGASRYQFAATAASKVADRLRGTFDITVRTFASSRAGSVPVDPGELASRKPDGQSTDLAAAIASSVTEDTASGGEGRAILLLSDGIHNAGGSAGGENGGVAAVFDSVRLAKAMAIPIYTRTFGGEKQGIDLAVELRSPQDLAFTGQKVPIAVRIRHTGIGAGKTSLALLQDGKEIARRSIELSPAGPSDSYFMVSQDKTGVYSYEVRADALTGEATTANNSTSYLLRVVDEPIRVLLLEGKPYWDSKFLVRTLTADPAIALDSIVRLTDNRLMRRTLSGRAESRQPTVGSQQPPAGDADPPATAPTTQPRLETWKIIPDATEVLSSPEHLKGYQIVVLGRDSEIFLTDTAISNLQNWIATEGGSLVCYRGAPATQVNQKLSRLLPVKWQPSSETRFRVKLTDQGRDLHWWPAAGANENQLLAQLPALARTAQVDQSKPLAVVLATAVSPAGEKDPAVVYQPYGTGRVVVIEGAGMWRWAFLPAQDQGGQEGRGGQEQAAVYAGMWQSLLRWLTSNGNLTPGQQMTLRADKVSFANTESATATLLVREEGAARQQPLVELSPAGVADGHGAASIPPTFAPIPVGEEPGMFRLDFGKLPDGRYQAHIVGRPTDDSANVAIFDVRSFGDEQLDLKARPDLMARIASLSDGVVVDDSAADEIAASFRQHLARLHPPQFERRSAWDKWWLLTAIFVVWTLSWTLRRSGGLV
jgi:hypothetical protein